MRLHYWIQSSPRPHQCHRQATSPCPPGRALYLASGIWKRRYSTRPKPETERSVRLRFGLQVSIHSRCFSIDAFVWSLPWVLICSSCLHTYICTRSCHAEVTLCTIVPPNKHPKFHIYIYTVYKRNEAHLMRAHLGRVPFVNVQSNRTPHT